MFFWLLKILGITSNVFMLPGHLQTRQKQKSYYTQAAEKKVTSQIVKYRDQFSTQATCTCKRSI